ncbi:MAG: preprotein translocase subunit SecG [Oscillospiraceae bacterium]|nr:preprotein translocase subunit SecG [Oscillospiraceae bacterium]
MVVFRLRCYAFTSYFLTTQKGLNLVNTLTIIFTVIQLLASLFLIAVILLQSGKSAGLSGAISGGADTFMSKGKAKTLDAKLAKMTKWVALGFVLLTLVLNLL